MQVVPDNGFKGVQQTILYFTITADILARSLANFHSQYADRHTNLQLT